MLFQPDLLLLIFVTPRLLIPGFELPGLCFPVLTLMSQCNILRSPCPTKYCTWITENTKNSFWLRWCEREAGSDSPGEGWGAAAPLRTFVCWDLDTKYGILPWLSSQIHTGKYPSSKTAQLEPAQRKVLPQHHLCCSSISHPLLLWQGKERRKKLQLKRFPKVSAQQHLH